MKKEQKIEILALQDHMNVFMPRSRPELMLFMQPEQDSEPVHMLTTFHRMSCSVRSGRLISMTGDFILL